MMFLSLRYPDVLPCSYQCRARNTISHSIVASLLCLLIFNHVGNVFFPSLFLQQLYLRSEEEGKEEVTLQLLLNVSTQCGVCFPCNLSLTTSSIPLVHAVRDDTLLEVVTAFIWFYFITYL